MRKLEITELHRITTEEFKQTAKIPLVVVLDNVRSLHNVGSVFRTSDAFLVEKICLCGITSTPPQPEIHKTALGAEFSMDWQYYENTQDAVLEYKKKGYHIFSIEQVEGSIKLPDLQLQEDGKYVVILGNEVKGVQQEVVDMSDDSIEIPQYGTKHSLNVSVTSGIIIWSFFEKMRKNFR
ncbi:MAG: RNA methyltransferase [Paludibacteraceae bacterium]|nr:RNA methyltransferase [Paludibacteraceae bacterium]